MIGLLLPPLIAALLALLTHRQRGAPARGFRFAWTGVVVAAFATELVLYNPPIDRTHFALTYGPWIWTITRTALLLAVLRNLRLAGNWSIPCAIMAVGLGLNTMVILANDGYMPQSTSAAYAVWGPDAMNVVADPGRLHNTRPMDGSDKLTWLGDVLPQPAWLPRANVVSVGDVILSLGMAAYVFASLKSLRPARQNRDPGPIPHVQLRKDVLDVGLDRLHRDDQLRGNLAIRQAAGDQPRNIAFPFTQRVEI